MRAVILMGLLSLFGQVNADTRSDHERAREARLRDEIRPITEIWHQVGEQVPGEVIRIELEQEKDPGQWIGRPGRADWSERTPLGMAGQAT